MRRSQINSDFGNSITVDPRVALQAAKAVAIQVENVDDARVMLDMLGLIPPQPGFEEVSKKDDRNRLARDRLEMKRLRGEKSKREKARMKKYGITPEEIGDES